MEDLRQLILSAQNGNTKALNQLCSNWYHFVFNLAYKYFADEATASDISQQAFINVQQKLTQLSDPAGFKSWLCRIVINLCHTENRRQQQSSKMKLHFTDYQNGKNAAYTDQRLYQEEKSQMVLKALQMIPEEQRLVIIMKEYEGLKFKEIADMLQTSESTVKSRLYYGLKALHKIFSTQYKITENILEHE